LSALDPARAGQALGTLTEWARDSAATLVTSLHDVPLALQYFPRIIGLRDGRLMFDLPPGQVTASLLRELYAQEPAQAAPVLDDGDARAVPRPVVMHCR
jgi:phosphonate transport system ATP-binding protein